MEAALTLEYLLFLLSAVLTALGLLFIGSIARSIRRKRYTSLKKKILLFPLFIVGIFGIGWLSERAQQGIFAYLQQNAAAGISGIVIAVLVAWFLYDWVLWRGR